jgi:hypothetical protein
MKKMIIGWSIGFAIALLLTIAINPPDEICILMGFVFGLVGAIIGMSRNEAA